MAVSIPLRSFEDAVGLADREKQEMVTVRPGVLRMSKAGNKEECLLVQNTGPSAARLVCGQSSKDLETLGDWLARGLGGTPPANNDLVASFRARPVRDRFLTPLRKEATDLGEKARGLLSAQSVTDPELVAAPGIILDEGIQFLQDLDGVDIHVSLADSPAQLAVGGTLRFGARNAWLTQVLVSPNDKAGAPPAMFWHAPRDAYSASWGRRGNPHLFDGVTRVLHKALSLALDRTPIPAAEKQAIDAFLTAAPSSPPTWVSAQGVVHPTKKRAKPSAKPSPAETLAEAKVVATTTIGWHLVGVDAPAANYVAWGKQTVDLYAHAVKLVQTFASAAKSKTSDADRRLLGLIPKLTTVTSPPGWPAGTVAFDLEVTYDTDMAAILLPKKDAAKPSLPKPAAVKPGTVVGPVKIVAAAAKPSKPAGPRSTITLRLAVVPDGAHTWIGLSADLDELKSRLVACLDSAPREGTLAAREGLSALNNPGQTFGGFFSAGQIVQRVLEEAEHKHPGEIADVKALFAKFPNRWETPILWVGSGTTGPTPTTGWELRFQTGTLADVAAVVTLAMSPQGKELMKKLGLD